MNIKSLKIFFFLFTSCISIVAYGQVRVYGPPSLTSLVDNAQSIYRANFISEKNENYCFASKNLNSNQFNLDTFKVTRLSTVENTAVQENDQNIQQNGLQVRGSRMNWNKRYVLDFKEADEFIFFNSQDKDYHYCFVQVGEKIYRQGYFEKMNQEFVEINSEISWEEFKEMILSIKLRFDRINHLKNIENIELRNKMLFKWIDDHKLTFDDTCYQQEIYIDCGWKHKDVNAFRWITEGGVAKDTWNASKLYRQIKFSEETEWLGFTGLLSDYNGNSFKSYADIEFLIEIAINDSSKIIDRKQALSYLSTASRKVYENNYPVPETKILNQQKSKQKSIRDRIIPLLKDQYLKRFAFKVIRNMSNPMDGIIDHRIDLETLPLIIDYYKNEKPSEFKSELAEFIVHNSTEEEWKVLSNCDKRIFVDLYSVYIDTIQHQLRFGINYDYGREIINDKPIVIIKKRTTNEIVFQENYTDFKLPYSSHNGVRYIYINLENFKKDQYIINVKGKAGEESQYIWNSEYGEFTIK